MSIANWKKVLNNCGIFVTVQGVGIQKLTEMARKRRESETDSFFCGVILQYLKKILKKLVKNAVLHMFNVEYIGCKIFGENVYGVTYKT